MSALNRRALNRALLARQLLLERSSLSPVEAIEHLLGLQAQAPMPPYFGLWTRLRDFDPTSLSMLITSREVVRIALMRSTIHLVSASDCLALRPILQPMLERALTPGGQFGRRLVGVDLDAVARAGRALVEESPLTNAELGAALRRHWPDRDSDALVAVVRTRVPLVQVPPRGLWGRAGQPRSTSAESWLGRRAGAGTTVDALVLRYLAAFGPASVMDAQAWSGLTGLRPAFERLRGELEVFEGEDGVELFDLPDGPRPDPATPVPVRLLPEFDSTLLAHVDRRRIISEPDRLRLFSQNGIIGAAVLVDGFVRGSWRLERAKSTASVLVTPFAGISKRHAAAVTAEARRVLTFAAPDLAHEIRILF